jgi:hypothetical protein
MNQLSHYRSYSLNINYIVTIKLLLVDKVTKGIQMRNVFHSLILALISTAFFLSCKADLKVINGTGSGEYNVGSIIDITANTPSKGERFYMWEGNVIDTYSFSSKVRPTRNMTVEATYLSLNETCNVVVSGGTGSKTYFPGELATIKANEPESEKFKFKSWSGDISYLDNPKIKKQSFRVPKDISLIDLKSTYAEAYDLVIKNGSGDGKYIQNESVTIKADPAPSKMIFDMWIGDVEILSNRKNSSQNIKMPPRDINLEATYRDGYEVKVTNGKGDGIYAPGDKVIISANSAPKGKTFDEWSGDTNFLSDPSKSSQSFNMLSNNLTFSAHYKDVNPISYTLQHVFTGPTSSYKLVGMLGTPYGLFVTTSNVYRAGLNQIFS